MNISSNQSLMMGQYNINTNNNMNVHDFTSHVMNSSNKK